LLAEKVVELEYYELISHTEVGQILKKKRNERHLKCIKIDWQFSIRSARSKLNSHYSAVQNANQIFLDS